MPDSPASAAAEDNATLREQLATARQRNQEGTDQESATTPPSQDQESDQQSTSQEEAQSGTGWLDQQSPEVQAEVRRLRGEAANLRNERNELRNWRTTRERETMSETERLTAERDDLQRQLTTVRQDSLRNQVAIARGLPADAIDFLAGETQEELERNADRLKSMIGTRPQDEVDFGAGVRRNGGSTGAEEDMSSVLRRAAGRPA
jgi:hypothetical protein